MPHSLPRRVNLAWAHQCSYTCPHVACTAVASWSLPALCVRFPSALFKVAKPHGGRGLMTLPAYTDYMARQVGLGRAGIMGCRRWNGAGCSRVFVPSCANLDDIQRAALVRRTNMIDLHLGS